MRKVVFLFLSISLVLTSLANVQVKAVTDLTASTTRTSTSNQSTIQKEILLPEYGYQLNFDYAADGIVRVFYNNAQEKKMKLVIQKDDERYIYNVFNNAEFVNYPLQLGDGQYKVSLYENTTGTKYKKITSKYYNVVLEDKNNVYLQSILEINWKEDDESIILANQLVNDALEAKKEGLAEEDQDQVTLTEKEIIDVIYEYVIDNISYDYDKIKGLDYSYVPNNDVTLEVGTGICYDYSSLLASMLRSQGIPTKMTKGYANTSNVYHAWNEIYLSDEERWIVVDPTHDAYMVQNGYSYSLEKASSNYNKVKEF